MVARRVEHRIARVIVERGVDGVQVQQFVERHPLGQFVGRDLPVDQVAEEVVREFLFDARRRVGQVAAHGVLGLVPLVTDRLVLVERIDLRKRIGTVEIAHRFAEIHLVEGVRHLVGVVVDQTLEVDVRRRAIQTRHGFVVLIEPAGDLFGIDGIVLDRGVFQQIADVEPREHVPDLEVSAGQVGDLLLGKRLGHAVEIVAFTVLPADDIVLAVLDRGVFQKIADVQSLEGVVDREVPVGQVLDLLLGERLGHAVKVLAVAVLPADDVPLAVLDGGIVHQVADVQPGDQVVGREAAVQQRRQFLVCERTVDAVGRIAAVEPAGDVARRVVDRIELLEEADVGIHEQRVGIKPVLAHSVHRTVGKRAHHALDACAVGVEPVDDDPGRSVAAVVDGSIAEQIADLPPVDQNADIERQRAGRLVLNDDVADGLAREDSVQGLVFAARDALHQKVEHHVVHTVVDDGEHIAAVADHVKRLAEVDRAEQFEQRRVRGVFVDGQIVPGSILFVLHADQISEFHTGEQVGHFQVDDLFQGFPGQRLARRLRQNVVRQELEQIGHVGMFEDRRQTALRKDLLHRERTDARRDLLHDLVGDLQSPAFDEQVDRDRLVEVPEFLDLGNERLDGHGGQVDLGVLVDVLPLVCRNDAPLFEFVKRDAGIGVVPHPEDRPDTGQKSEEESEKQSKKTRERHGVLLSDTCVR